MVEKNGSTRYVLMTLIVVQGRLPCLHHPWSINIHIIGDGNIWHLDCKENCFHSSWETN